MVLIRAKISPVEMFVSQSFPIECNGRDSRGSEILSEPMQVSVNIYKSPSSSMISSKVTCPYNGGAHGGNCYASQNKDALCPYAFDIPHCLE